MNRPKKIKVTDVNPFLICVLCGGYYIDATTIIECLHSFCRSCIVKYLEKNKYCPICDVQIHKSNPLQNIRNDKTLQTIVYKLVPSLFQNEMRRRNEFYKREKGDLPCDPEARGEVGEHSSIILPEEQISICLEYLQPSSDLLPKSKSVAKRYLHCPGAVTVGHLDKLLRGKFSLSSVQHSVQFYFKEDLLPDTLTLMDVAYTYQWRRKGPIQLSYRILELRKKSFKKEGEVKESEEEKKEWKEVELQISENGVMSVRGIAGDVKSVVSNLVRNSELEVVAVGLDRPSQLEANKVSISRAKGEALNRIVSRLSPNERLIGNTSVSIRPVPSLPSPKPATTAPVKTPSVPVVPAPATAMPAPPTATTTPAPAPPPSPSPTPSVLSLFKQPSQNCVVVGNVTVSKETPAAKSLDQVPRVSVSLTKEPAVPPSRPRIHQFKYRSLRFPSKTWNPSIDRTTALSMKQRSPPDPAKPAKFFKARNTPRFLGNPSEGVKPMYQVCEHQESERGVARSPRPPPYTPGSPKRSVSSPWARPGRLPSPAHTPALPPYPPLLFPGFLSPRLPPADLLRMFPSILLPPLRPPTVQPVPPSSKAALPAPPSTPPSPEKTPRDHRTINNNLPPDFTSQTPTSVKSSPTVFT